MGLMLLVLGPTTLTTAIASPPDGDGNLCSSDGAAALRDRVAPACVEILASGRLAGSGWFASADGYVVTARHVVRVTSDPSKLEVLQPDAVRRPARLIATDPGHDLALLKVEPAEEPYPFLPVAEAMPPVGGRVYLYGQMFLRHGLLLPGMVARPEPVYEYLAGSHQYIHVTVIAPALVGGVSGGPWVDLQGRVIGNQSSTLSQGHSPVGASFAANLPAIQRLVEEKTTARVPTLGIANEELWEKPEEVLDRFPPGTSALFVAIVNENGPAAKAGIAKGMVIRAVDARPVRYRDELLDHIRARQPGETVALSILEPNNPQPRDVSVELGQLPE
jgi:serine protease Do